MESEVITLQDVFQAHPVDERAAELDPHALLMPLESTGLQPHFQAKLAANGVVLPAEFYEPELTEFELSTNGSER